MERVWRTMNMHILMFVCWSQIIARAFVVYVLEQMFGKCPDLVLLSVYKPTEINWLLMNTM